MNNFRFNPQEFGQMMNNPVQFLMSKGLNVPQNLANDPKAMVQHLMNSGRMNQNTFNNLDSFRRQFENRMNKR